MNISQFQRLLKGVILPVAALAWIATDVVTSRAIDPALIVLWAAMFGYRFLPMGLSGDQEDKP